MGKQSKRKGGKRRGGDGGGRSHRHNPTGVVSPGRSTDETSENGGGTTVAATGVALVVKKIRHGDPRVRHAALAALGSTLYDPTSLSSPTAGDGEKKKREKKNGRGGTVSASVASASDPTLLRALAERLLDDDVPCAIAAAGCLSNYSNFRRSPGLSSEDDDEDGVASEVLAPILLERIRRSSEGLRTLGERLRTTAASASLAEKEDNVTAVEDVRGKKSKRLGSSAPATSQLDKLLLASGEQWSLLALALQTLGALIENHPKALERMGGSGFGYGVTGNSPTAPFAALVGVLSLAATFAETVDGGSALPDGGGAAADAGGNAEESARGAATGAARALHSALDDNPSLVRSSTAVASSEALLRELRVAVENKWLPNAARLHACGALLVIRRVLVEDVATTASSSEGGGMSDNALAIFLQDAATEVVLPLLHESLELDTTVLRGWVTRIIDLGNEARREKDDERMESDVVRMVDKRREPARMIAKRQKKIREQKKAEKVEVTMDVEGQVQLNEVVKDATGEAGMVVEDASSEGGDGGDGNAKGGSGELEGSPGDKEGELDRAVQSWKELTGTLKLALEIAANLCAGRDGDDGNCGGDEDIDCSEGEDDHMWDSDDEAKFIDELSPSGVSQRNDIRVNASSHPLDRVLLERASSAGLPDRVVTLLGRLSDFIFEPVVGGGGCPKLVNDDLTELLSTCSLCLGNAIACDALSAWQSEVGGKEGAEGGVTLTEAAVAEKRRSSETLWRELAALAGRCVALPPQSSFDDEARTAATTAVASSMLAALRHRPETRAFVDASGLELITSLLSWERKSKEGSGGDGVEEVNAASEINREAVSMLGVLCSEPHSDDVDARVCAALLTALRLPSSHASVTSEVLNVLMDMYGDDDDDGGSGGPGGAFISMDVIGHFRRCLPAFKRQIRRGGAGVEPEVWSETALNASRFIKYKESRCKNK